jgi:hypothetical protein
MSGSLFLNIDMDVNLTVPCDTSDDVTYAAKILTAFATKMTRQGRLHELENLQAISELTDLPPYLPELIDHFETTGPHGDHLCFILGLQSTDVGSFRLAAPTRRLLLHDVQMVILYVLNALAILHKLGLIHTGTYCSLCSFQSLTILLRCQAKRRPAHPRC